MVPKIVCIYIPLLDEGVPVIRPTSGERLEDAVFRILPTEDYNPEIETWAFPPGAIVQCAKEVWEGNEIWVAREKYNKPV